MQFSLTGICTDDSDEFREWEQAIGIDAQRTQLSWGKGIYQADFAVLDDFAVWRYREPQRVLTDFALPEGFVEICFARSTSSFIWCGTEIPKSTVAIHLGGKEYRSVLPEGAMTYGIVVPQTSNWLVDLISYDLTEDIRKGGNATAHAPHVQLDSVIRWIEDFVDEPMHPEFTRNQLISSCNHLVDKCFPVHVAGTQLAKRELVDSAMDLIGQRKSTQLSVQDILNELCVSRRVLERAFRDYVGVTPLRFLHASRLHLARRLIKSNQHSVLNACLESGFNHPSRFAEMYARQFGELPSETKKQSVD